MSSALGSKLPVAESFDAVYLEQWEFFPLDLDAARLRIAAPADPPPEVLQDLADSFQVPVEVVLVPREDVLDAIRHAFSAAESVVELVKTLDVEADVPGAGETAGAAVADARDLATQPPVIKFVNALIKEANEARASDIHLEATREGLHVRYRIDGVLMAVPSPQGPAHAAVVSRIKLLAELDIAERRLPQDGRIRVRLADRELDLRVSTVPTLYGESVVLRLLDHGGRPVALDELGMDADTLGVFRRLAQRPHGILLATGPTGSGKTTTLYAALGLRRRSEEKIVTIEDPVEYHLDLVTQMQMNAKAGMTFAMALRSVLRQDPDVVMVGEMRDAETAGIAVQAAMTGHLVFSTLHTNDAPSAILRLLNLGVAPDLIGGAVEGILAQRLVRKTCPACRERYQPDPAAVALLAQQPVGRVTLERGRGCPQCRETGYRGRTGIYELLVVTPEMMQAIPRTPSPATLRQLAQSQGMVTLKEDGWRKVQAGITTVEEVLRVAEH
jgi:type II secretory ATPase GspE/PulE/Tfp pilus assembly ATPase PilB-like protein